MPFADTLAPPPVVPDEARALAAFWRAAGPSLWFAKDAEFDARFRTRFLAAHEGAAAGGCAAWRETAEGALALVLLLDQFPRNAFRGTPRMYATDAAARQEARAAVAAGHDIALADALRLFLYLPFAHSEALEDQHISAALTDALGEPHRSRALHHRDIIRRFGRFPHRNAVLGRASTAEEAAWLAAGGFAG